ncbi:VOC family protein [Aidingimonas lacisalsi]|uniref:VOC family protein n=1 Tax=Aidingimonas lacisalsi TaxID=2604086 RepID=UPI0011D257E0|nr:VOC family protein [Aidingimonas lacisalsi]
MYSHVTFGSSDLDRAAAFYDAVLAELGMERRSVSPDGGPASACWVLPGQSLPRFYVYEPFDGKPASAGNGNMVAFAASSPAVVRVAYQAAMAAGARGEGAPGERQHYGIGYYGAYFRDLDGNKVHVVYRGDIE